MGVIFHWFKNYKIEEYEHPVSWGISDYDYSVEYIDDDATSHSYGNRTKLENLFKEVGITIPNISNEIHCEEPEKYIQSLLIEPSVMSLKCQELLDSNLDLNDMEDKIQWIKELSDSGYYVAYDMF